MEYSKSLSNNNIPPSQNYNTHLTFTVNYHMEGGNTIIQVNIIKTIIQSEQQKPKMFHNHILTMEKLQEIIQKEEELIKLMKEYKVCKI